MTTTTTNHPAAPTSSSPLPKLYTSTPSWRCNPHDRLHRDGEACTGSPPTSPIIDTPSKRVRMERKRNAALLGNSQATTQPTPSRPASAPSTSRAQATANDDSQEEDMAPATLLQAANAPVDNRHEFDYTSPNPSLAAIPEEEEDDFNLARTPSQHASDRIPETPLNLPSSPPLTASNLSALQDQAPAPPPDQLPSAAAAASPAPPPPASIRSLSSAVAHQISRLILRTEINAAQYQASTRQLVVAQGDLTVAHGQVRQEIVRGDGWRDALVAVLVLGLAYVIWCWWHSVEFEFLEESRRKWYGL